MSELVRLRDKIPALTRRRIGYNKAQRRAMKEHADWENSEEARDMVQSGMLGQGEFEDLFPQDFGKKLPEEGAWIQIKTPPATEYTVPPFSVWFGVPWPSANCGVCGVKAKRVKIITPAGTLGIWPHEYFVVKDIRDYIGREPEGIMLRQMNDKPVCDKDHLFYLMSRGITRQRATLMLIHSIKDPTFLWLEFAPQYGEYFGKRWPRPDECPFAQNRKLWIPEKEAKLLTKKSHA